MAINKYNSLLNRNNFIILFFLFLILNYLFFNYRILFRENGYILGDWLINYNGGFVRRGLIGHLFFNLSKELNISIINIIFFFSSSIYIATIFLFYKIVKDKLHFNIILIFLFLPSTFLFNFFDPLTAGRKEIIVIFFFLIYYLYLNVSNSYSIFLIYSLSIITLLTHEILFFQIPYLFLLRYLHLKKYNRLIFKLKDYSLEICIFLTSLIIMLFIFSLTKNHDNDLLCKSLTEIGLSTNVCYGSINDLRVESVFSSLWPYFLERNYFFNYSIYALISLSPLVYIYLNTENFLFKKKLFLLLLFCFTFSLIFIPRVNDWGRYLNLSFLLQFLVCLKFIEINFNLKKYEINLNKSIKVFLILILITSWHMPHCCNPNLGNGYYDIFKRIKSRITDETTNSTKYKDMPREFLRKLLKID